jgi:hypothetical protein
MQPQIIDLQPQVSTLSRRLVGGNAPIARAVARNAFEGLLMRKITTGAVLAFACLGVASASAETLRLNGGNTAADFGGGGWTQSYTARSSASGAIAAVKNVTVVTGSDRGFRGFADFDRRLHWLAADADCLFPPAMALAGRPWRPGCK